MIYIFIDATVFYFISKNVYFLYVYLEFRTTNILNLHFHTIVFCSTIYLAIHSVTEFDTSSVYFHIIYFKNNLLLLSILNQCYLFVLLFFFRKYPFHLIFFFFFNLYRQISTNRWILY